MNFGQLVSEVANWLDRDDLEDTIKFAINAAIRQCERRYDFKYMHKVVSLTSSDGTLSLPSDYKKPDYLIYVTSGDRKILTETAPRLGAAVDYSGSPDYYWIGVMPDESVKKIIIKPAPADGSEFEFGYYAYSDELSGDADTHWLLTNAPELILFGALILLQSRILEDVRIAALRDQYNQLWNDLIIDIETEKTSGSPQRIAAGVPVV